MNLHLVLFPKVLLALLAMAALMAAQTSKTPDWRAIHDSAIVIDTHADTPSRFVDESSTHFQLPSLPPSLFVLIAEHKQPGRENHRFTGGLRTRVVLPHGLASVLH